jgi:hypothetical protein
VLGQEGRDCVVELYLSMEMTAQQVVDHLGYPTRQCLERWLHRDSRYSGSVSKPIVPLRRRREAVELCLACIQQKQVAARLDFGIGAVHRWVERSTPRRLAISARGTPAASIFPVSCCLGIGIVTVLSFPERPAATGRANRLALGNIQARRTDAFHNDQTAENQPAITRKTPRLQQL